MKRGALIARGCIVTSLLAWSATASAFMGYPPIVDKWLGKDGLVEMLEKPTGCQLCHVSDQGGTVDLRPFGNLLVAQYGLPKNAEQDTVLMGVLAELEAANQPLFEDMQKGIDPNTDPALTAQALPQPQYGCAAADPRTQRGWPSVILGMLPLALAFRRRRRRILRGPPE
jgi:hypothetical protein